MSYDAIFKDADGNTYLSLAGVSSFIVYEEQVNFTADTWYDIENLNLTSTNSWAIFSSPVDIRGVYSNGTLHLRPESTVTVTVYVVKLI